MKAKTFLEFAVQKWWVIYGISLGAFFIWLAITLFGSPSPKSTHELVFYPWIYLREYAGIVSSIPLVIFILGIVLYGLKKKSIKPALLLFTITVICCVVFLALIGPWIGTVRSEVAGFEMTDPTLTHVTSIRTSQHVYNLASHQTASARRGKSYVFYECDSLGISCHALYRYRPTSLEDVYADDDNPPFFSSDNTGIKLYIGGKVVYTLPISNANSQQPSKNRAP